jgi:hypothetical protein
MLPVAAHVARQPHSLAVDAAAVAIDIIFPAATIAFPPAIAIRSRCAYDSTTCCADGCTFGNAKARHDRASHRAANRTDARAAQAIARRFTRAAAHAGCGCQSGDQ